MTRYIPNVGRSVAHYAMSRHKAHVMPFTRIQAPTQYQHIKGLRIEERRKVEEAVLGEEMLEGLRFGKIGIN
jgi:hypothetical protein